MTTNAPVRTKDQPNWNSRNKKMQALGLTSMDELRHVERLERGTGQQRQKPRKHDRDDRAAYAAPVGSDKQSFLERLWEFIDREIGRESDFPKDGTHDGQVSRVQQAGHVYAEGDTLTVKLAGDEYTVTVTSCYDVFYRLRYRIAFPNGAQMALTQAILLRIRVAPPVALAPTHLLPAPSVPTVTRIHYRDLVLEGEAAVRVFQRLQAHWQRQLPKLSHPHGLTLPEKICV